MSDYAGRQRTGEPTIVFFGTGELGCPTLKTLLLNRIPVKLVVTSPDRPAGRGLKLTHSRIKDMALEAGLAILQPADVNEPYVIEHIRKLQCDLGLLVAYGQKLGGDLIRSFAKGVINLHASLLPKYRGAAPVNWAILNGERETGLTVMQIDEAIDTGMILDQLVVNIREHERADELHDRLAELGGPIVLKVIREIHDGSIVPRPQDTSQAVWAPKLDKHLGQIDWNLSAEMLVNRVHGLWPWPAARSWYVARSGKAVQVSFARARSRSSERGAVDPGTVFDDLSIACGSGRLEPVEVKPSGGKLIRWQDFVNGRHVQPGDRFTDQGDANK